MSSRFVSSLSRLSLAAVSLPVLALVATAPAAHAQDNLTFMGGNGTPLTINFLNPVTYIATAASSSGVLFDFQGAGNTGNFNGTSFTSLTFQVNGGTTRTVNGAINSVNVGNEAGTDLIAYSSAFPNVATGDVVTLFSGTIITSSSVTGAPPANGAYTTFLTTNNTSGSNGPGARISSNGIAGAASAPEPGSIALLALAGMPSVGMIARRRQKAAQAQAAQAA